MLLEPIVCVDRLWGFSRNNRIPWHKPEDLKLFAKLTKTTQDPNKKNVCIMGRITWENIPEKYRPLKDRINIVVSNTIKTIKPIGENTYHSTSIEGAVKMAVDMYMNKQVERIFICGGESLYNYALNSFLLKQVHITKLNEDFKCDKFIDKNLLFKKCHIETQLDTEYPDMVYSIFTKKAEYNKPEEQYLKLLWDVYNGDVRQTRNSITSSIFGASVTCDLSKGFPLLTTKKMFMRGIFEELKFFLMGDTNAKHLADKNIHIWDANTTREFLDANNLSHYKEYTMGPMYGFNWLYFGQKYIDADTVYDKNQTNQLKYVLDTLKKDRNSRRIMMTTFNPATVKECVLWACHSIVIQFHCVGNKLNCIMYQRSCDIIAGFPFNWASTALLVKIICQLVNNSEDNQLGLLEEGTLTIYLGDVHLYHEQTHLNALKEQITRNCYDFPKLEFNKKFKEIEELNWENIVISDYVYHPAIKINMVA